MHIEDRIKLFGLSHSLVERDLDRVEQRHKIDLQRSSANDRDEEYYPQFDLALRSDSDRSLHPYHGFGVIVLRSACGLLHTSAQSDEGRSDGGVEVGVGSRC